ncbi:UNVERIFIED_CONTAM: Retrovirus-related Pol polyprotein from transposon gypsy [Sesamum latifolium]|uniref:RNA-directed DNA polymerase n=1 Tax=Sesamum latifolium TaxID=2727402 RepID=A0AAW2TP82_9LAMI
MENGKDQEIGDDGRIAGRNRCGWTKSEIHRISQNSIVKDEIERLVRQGYFKEYKLERSESRDCKVGDRRTRSRSRSPNRFRGKEEDRRDKGSRENVPVKGVINTIAGGPGGGDSRRTRKQQERAVMGGKRKEWVMNVETEEEITFSSKDLSEGQGTQDDPMVIKLDIANFEVHKVLIDNGSSTDIIFWDVLKRMNLENSNLSPVRTPLVGFGGSEVSSMGTIDLPVSMGEEPRRRTAMVKFLVVDIPFAYNVILGRPALNLFRVVVSTYHQKMKFQTRNGVGEVSCDTKEKKRSFGVERNRIIEEEVNKLKEAGYVSEVQYTDWLANVVVVPKASEKWRMCTDFTDLNKACPKDPYPLPRIDLLVDSTAGYELFSMMDAYQGYHQIFMAEEDRIKTSFITDRGIYCYNVMPFGLKKQGGKFLGYMVSERGIEANPEKIEAIAKLQSPRTLKEVQQLTGAEKRYTQIEKLALALVVLARKLRPYFQSHKVIVLTNYPLRHVMTRPDASGRLVKWAVELGEYDIEYQSRTAIKAQVLTDFVVEFAGEQVQEEKGVGCCMSMDRQTPTTGESVYYCKG